MLSESDCNDVLNMFPEVEFALAYGSGVVEQDGYDYQKKDNFPMLDIILVVNDSEQWHAVNMLRNPSHYTSLIPLTAPLVARFQEGISANFWFNAYIPMNSPKFPGRLMKYGIISKEHLLQDLNNWSQLYIAGRLHKPVHILKKNEEIEKALAQNYEHAIRTSLLLLPGQFNEFDLYTSVASLSYIGDPRMFIGENPKKIVNLVTPIVHHYKKLYQPAFNKLATEADVVKIEDSSLNVNATIRKSNMPSGSYTKYSQVIPLEGFIGLIFQYSRMFPLKLDGSWLLGFR